MKIDLKTKTDVLKFAKYYRIPCVDGKRHKVYYPTPMDYIVRLAIERAENNLDTLVIITGKVGSGKSNIGIGLGILYEYLKGRKLTLDDIYFTPENFLGAFYSKENATKALIYDEAVTGATGRDSMSMVGKYLRNALITKRYKRHFIILNIDNIKELSDKVIERSVVWIHVYYRKYYNKYVKGIFKIFPPEVAEIIWEDLKNKKYLRIDSHPLFRSNRLSFKANYYLNINFTEKEYQEKKESETNQDSELLKSITNVKITNRIYSAPVILKRIMKDYNITMKEIENKYNINHVTFHKLFKDAKLIEETMKDKLILSNE